MHWINWTEPSSGGGELNCTRKTRGDLQVEGLEAGLGHDLGLGPVLEGEGPVPDEAVTAGGLHTVLGGSHRGGAGTDGGTPGPGPGLGLGPAPNPSHGLSLGPGLEPEQGTDPGVGPRMVKQEH